MQNLFSPNPFRTFGFETPAFSLQTTLSKTKHLAKSPFYNRASHNDICIFSACSSHTKHIYKNSYFIVITNSRVFPRSVFCESFTQSAIIRAYSPIVCVCVCVELRTICTLNWELVYLFANYIYILKWLIYNQNKVKRPTVFNSVYDVHSVGVLKHYIHYCNRIKWVISWVNCGDISSEKRIKLIMSNKIIWKQEILFIIMAIIFATKYSRLYLVIC